MPPNESKDDSQEPEEAGFSDSKARFGKAETVTNKRDTTIILEDNNLVLEEKIEGKEGERMFLFRHPCWGSSFNLIFGRYICPFTVALGA